ncbi:hypothetical protein ACI3K0_29225 [Rhizobium sp. ZW T2_16]
MTTPVGHIYRAKPALAGHYRSLDPTNSFNPGIGKTERSKRYGSTCGCDDHFSTSPKARPFVAET